MFDLSQDLRTNTQSEGPNAVTWGVFPGKEIIQPTIVEAVSFIAWKDEAFAIGSQWARLYPDGSKSRALIEGIMDSYYLVNVRPFTPPPPPFLPKVSRARRLSSRSRFLRRLNMRPLFSLAPGAWQVVHNAFKEKEAIFAPFDGLGTSPVVGGGPNGKALPNGIKA